MKATDDYSIIKCEMMLMTWLDGVFHTDICSLVWYISTVLALTAGKFLYKYCVENY